MRRLLVALALVVLFFLHPLLAAAALALYAARRRVAVYASLWRRAVTCDKTTPLSSTAGLVVALLVPHGDIAKIILISLGLFAAYVAPFAPRTSRTLSILTVGLAAPVDFKILAISVAGAAAFLAYRLETCGYICQKSTALPIGDLAYIPDLGVACVFARGGRDVLNVYLKLGGRLVKCRFFTCREVGQEEFSRAVGTVERYLLEPTREIFRGLVRVVSPPHTALKILANIFGAVVVVSDKVSAARTSLSSPKDAPPEVVSCVAGGVYRLSPEEKALVEDLLRRGTREEINAWATRHRWLKFLVALRSNAEKVEGAVKSVHDGELGVIDSLIFAIVNKVPVLTDDGFVAAAAAKCGALVFFISDRAQDDFIVVGPAAIDNFEVGAGGYVVHVGGEYYGGNTNF